MNAPLTAGDPIAEYEAAQRESDLATGTLHRHEVALRAELAKALKPFISDQVRARKVEAAKRRAARAWLKQQPASVLAEVRARHRRSPNAAAHCCAFAGLEAPSPENGMRTDLVTCPLHSDAMPSTYARFTGRLGAERDD